MMDQSSVSTDLKPSTNLESFVMGWFQLEPWIQLAPSSNWKTELPERLTAVDFILPPMQLLASRTKTLWPFLASSEAAVMPAMPAPITMVWKFCSPYITMELAASKKLRMTKNAIKMPAIFLNLLYDSTCLRLQLQCNAKNLSSFIKGPSFESQLVGMFCNAKQALFCFGQLMFNKENKRIKQYCTIYINIFCQVRYGQDLSIVFSN